MPMWKRAAQPAEAAGSGASETQPLDARQTHPEVTGMNRLPRVWAGCFQYRQSSRVMGKLNWPGARAGVAQAREATLAVDGLPGRATARAVWTVAARLPVSGVEAMKLKQTER